MSTLISAKLALTRRRYLAFGAGVGVACAAAGLLSIVLATMLFDWLIELPTWARAGMLAIDLAFIAAMIVRHAILPIARPPDDDEIALWIERATPTLRSRLIASVQLSRPGALDAHVANGLARETIRQTESLADEIDFAGVVKSDRLMRAAIAAGISFTIFVIALAWGGRSSIDLLKRAFLISGVEVPRKTRVEIVGPSPQLVARGDSVALRARASGIIPENGTVSIQYLGANRAVEFPISRDAGKSDEFALTIDNVQTSFDCIVMLGDGHSATHRVEAADRPAPLSIVCRQFFPDYIGLPPAVRSPGDLSLVAGSRLSFEIVANKKIRRFDMGASGNRVHLHGVDRDEPLRITDDDGKHLATRDSQTTGVELPAKVSGFSVHLVDEQNLSSKDPAIYRIDLVPDKPPTLRMTSPARKDDVVTRRAKIIIGLEANDDYGLARLTLRYRIRMTDDDSNVKPATDASTIALNLPPRATAFRGYFPMQIDSLSPSPMEGQTVEWWIEAEDGNTLSGPGRAASEHYTARIVSDAEKRADLMSRLSGSMGQIDQVSESQRELSEKLGTLITEAESPKSETRNPKE